MALIDMILKYKSDGNELRLTVILETYNKKATKKNLDALKLLILDDDNDSIMMFLGDKEAIKKSADIEIEKQLQEEAKRPPNQDHFESIVISNFGDPKDNNALGNKILSGRVFEWYTRSHIKPDVQLRKFATMANKDYVEIDFHPNFGSNPLTWECCILGTKSLKRDRLTRVGE